MENVNMATDMALCRICKKVSKFSELVQEKRDEEILESLPRRMKVMKTARGLEVTYKKPKIVGFLYLFFSLFWNAVTYGLLLVMMNTKAGSNMVGQLFCIPFMLIGLGMFLATVYALFGRITLTLTPGRGELFRGVGNLGRRQQFVLGKDCRISVEVGPIQQNHKTLDKIVVEQPSGKPFEFGTEIAERKAQLYVAALLRQMRG